MEVLIREISLYGGPDQRGFLYMEVLISPDQRGFLYMEFRLHGISKEDALVNGMAGPNISLSDL